MNTPLRWLQVALECNRRDHSPDYMSGVQTGPTLSSRALAIAVRAMAEAYFRCGPHAALLPFTAVSTAAPGTHPESALHGAAVAVLTGLYPAMAGFLASESSISPPSDGTSLNFGRQVAADHLADRANDGSSTGTPYVYQNTPGAHQPDPENFSPGVHGPNYGQTRFFGVSGATHIHLDPPPGFVAPGRIDRSNSDYQADLQVVQTRGHRGIVENPSNTQGLTDALIGTFWAYDGVNQLGTPPRLYFQIIAKIVQDQGLGDLRQMFLYCLAATAMGDAAIHAWHWKYHYNIWRPVVGIRQHDASIGAEGQTVPGLSGAPIQGDPFWRPLGAPRTNRHSTQPAKNFTPPFPAYPSGHATFGGAAFAMTRQILAAFGKGTTLNGNKGEVPFTAVSDELNGVSTDVNGTVRPRHQRKFKSLEEAILENGLSRVWLGVHWQFDALFKNKNIGGIPLGKAIAKNIFDQHKTKAAGLPS